MSKSSVTKNLSCGGIQVETSQHFTKEDIIYVRFTINNKFFDSICKVIWVKELFSQNMFNIGLEFINISDKNYEILSKYLVD